MVNYTVEGYSALVRTLSIIRSGYGGAREAVAPPQPEVTKSGNVATILLPNLNIFFFN